MLDTNPYLPARFRRSRQLISAVIASLTLAASIDARAQTTGTSTPAEKQAQARGPGTIMAIDFTGLRRVEADAVRIVMTSRVGRQATPQAISEDIRAIYGTGYFDDVKVYQEKSSSGAIRLVYEVVEKPAVRKIDILGNDDVSLDDVKQVVDVRPFTILNEAKIKKNVQKIKDLYTEKGFYLAEVNYRIDVKSKTEVVVVFEIKENAKVQVRKIRFVGNKHLSSDLLKSGLATQEGNLLSFLSDAGTYRAEAFQVDIQRISAHYFDNGYINVRVDNPDIEISPDRKSLNITIRIDEGEQYSIGKVDFTGDLLLPKDQLFKLTSIRPNQVFNRSKLGQDLLGLKTRYEDDGYAYANITPATAIDANKRIIDIVFDVQKGQKVYYERINVVGNSKTRDKVVRRELRIYEGELTSATLRELSRRRVLALGYFEKVEVKTRKGSRDDLQVVDIEVKERATGTFQVGAGFSSAENFIFTAQISQDNFLGRGQSVAFSAQVSSLRQLFQLRFTDPYFYDTNWTFSVDAFNTETNFQSFLRSSTGGDLTFGYPLTEDQIIRVFLTYNLEFVKSSGSEGLTGQPAFASLNNEGRISSLRATLSYDTRDNRLFPNEGQYHSISAEASSELLGASANRVFERYNLFSRFYRPIAFGIVAKAAARFGLIHSPPSAELAPTEKYILGGINSIRGYAPFTIGPERLAEPNLRGTGLYDPYAGTFVFNEGGNKEFLLNLELEFPIFEEVGIKGVLFIDAGNAYAEDENFFYLDHKVRPPQSRLAFDPSTLPIGLFWSVGFGFRWFSPIGPLRFEWGIPLTPRPTDSRGPLFEFSIGNAF